MDRLTFLDNGSPAYRFKDCVYKNEIARRLYAYEDTGLSPAEIAALKAYNARLHKLLCEIECVIADTSKEIYDNKTFAKKLRERTVTNDRGIILVSPEILELILNRIEQSVLIKDDGSDTNE